MLADTFYWVLNMSITATISSAVVLLIRRNKFIPRTIIFILWGLPLIRMTIPFGLGYKYSIMTFLDRVAVRTVPLPTIELRQDVTMVNYVRGAESYFPIEYKTNLLDQVFSVASILWVLIAISSVLTCFVLYVLTKSEIRDAKHLRANIYVSNVFLSPVVFGIIHPKIILPEFLLGQDITHILKHESVHIRRMDNLWRVIAVLICCFHWFNPFVWWLLKAFFEDMELSCDEKILKHYDEEQRSAYAKALLQCEARKTIFASAFGGAKTRVRIEKILSYKKLTLFSASCFILLALVIAITLLTNAPV